MEETFASLRQVMLENAPEMVVAKDEPGNLSLETPWANPRKPKEAMWFGGVKLGKAYVAYHLMPIYTDAELAGAISETLKARQQGKSCFNFKSIDADQIKELASLTAACAAAYARAPGD